MEMEIKKESKVQEKGLLCDATDCKKGAITLQWVNEAQYHNIGIPFFLCKAHQDDVFDIYEQQLG